MIRQTQKKPHFFEVNSEEFKSIKLGYLDAGEIVLKYMDTILKLVTKLQDVIPQDTNELDMEELDLSGIINTLPTGFIKNLNYDALAQVYVRDKDDNGKKLESYSKVDPQDFSGIQENIKVLMEVFKHNFPDFFQGGFDIEGLEAKLTQTETKQVIPQETDKPVRKKL